MSVYLTWDLFILAFFGIVVAYSFIIGRNQALKIMTATYVAILSADAFGNIFAKYFVSSEAFLRFLRLFSIGSSEQAIAFCKIIILVTVVVLVAVRGAFDYSINDENPLGIRMTMSFTMGILSAGLMMSAMLIFVGGGSLITNLAIANNPINEIYSQSHLIRVMIDYANMWFLLPSCGIIFISLFYKK